MTEEKKPFKRYILIGLAVAAAIGAGWFIFDSMKYQSTDDAYIENTTVQVAPRVSGQVVKVMVNDNQKVKENDFVVEIDPEDYKIKMNSATARYDRMIANQKSAKANYAAMQSDINLAKKDLDRYTKLYAEGAVSKQTLDSAQTRYEAAAAKLTSADEAIMSKEGNKAADAEVKELGALKNQAVLDYSRTTVQAPISGTVTNKRVEKGMFVQAGTPLFTIVPDEVWVVANFKENQIRKMRPGQEVEIKVDTYPNKAFKGKVDSIQRSSGAKSSLFPPENAVGSFVKIVQRIPVKIVFDEKIDPDKYTIVPGMSVVPKVRVK
ncbi:MAG: HlyD family secretion protein [Heliobacteriaceae bacterium]|jgi:membrane fusion protein (multidrug efflux system)|nr:HlyD family secretion protein [Heliobacteriaceae bacterium]